MNYDRVYEVYRWWVRSGPNGGNRDPSRTSEKTFAMSAADQELLDKIIAQGGTYQPAFDYREAQKSGAGEQELDQFAPERHGFAGYSGRSVTRAERVEADAKGIDVAGLGVPLTGEGGQVTPTEPGPATVLGAEPTDTSDDRRLGGRPALAGGRQFGRRPGGRTALGPGAGGGEVGDVNIFGPPGGGFDPADGLAAARRARGRARRGGRQGTIIGGFGVGSPTTAPATLLGT